MMALILNGDGTHHGALLYGGLPVQTRHDAAETTTEKERAEQPERTL